MKDFIRVRELVIDGSDVRRKEHLLRTALIVSAETNENEAGQFIIEFEGGLKMLVEDTIDDLEAKLNG